MASAASNQNIASSTLFSTELEKPAETSVLASPVLFSDRKWRRFLLQSLYVIEQIASLFTDFSCFTPINILPSLVTSEGVILTAVGT